MFELSILGRPIISIGKKTTSSVDKYFSYIAKDGISQATAYSKDIWVYACVNAIARNAARVPFYLYKGDNEDAPITSGPAYDFFNSVGVGMNQSMLFEGTEVFKNITGNCYWRIYTAGNYFEMEFLDPYKIEPKVDSGGTLIGWIYTDSKGQRTPLMPEEVIHFKFFNPYNKFKGLSPLKAGMMSVEIENEIKNFNKAILINGAYPGNVIEADSKLGEAEFKRLKAELEEQHQGSKKAGKPLLLEGGLKYREIKISPSELQYLEQRKIGREEIHSAYRVPMSITGDTSSFNKANMADTLLMFWTQTLIPELKYIEDVINKDFLNHYFPGQNIKGKFDLSVIPELSANYNEKVTAAVSLAGIGFTANEINSMLSLGFGEQSWRDKWYRPMSMIPHDYEPAEPAAQEDPEEEPEEEKSIDKMINVFKKFNGEVGAKKEKEVLRKYYIWKKFDNAVRPIENKYARQMKKFYFELKSEVLNNLMDRGEDLLKSIKADKKNLFDVNAAKKKVTFISSPFIKDALETGGNIALDEAGITSQFEIVNTQSIAAFNTRLNGIKKVIDTVSKQVDEAVVNGIQEGKTLAQVAEDVKNVMNISQERADTIARTEIIGAANEGKFLAYEENGIDKHEWINSFDDKVRDEHLISEVVKIGDEFSNGLKYPGDRTGSGSTAENIINCRCSTAPIAQGE